MPTVLSYDIRRTMGDCERAKGINYPNFHTPETGIRDGLVARKSPLGWVIFGQK